MSGRYGKTEKGNCFRGFIIFSELVNDFSKLKITIRKLEKSPSKKVKNTFQSNQGNQSYVNWFPLRFTTKFH